MTFSLEYVFVATKFLGKKEKQQKSKAEEFVASSQSHSPGANFWSGKTLAEKLRSSTSSSRVII